MNAISLGLKPKKIFAVSRSSGGDNHENDDYVYSYDDIDFFACKESMTKRYKSIFIDEIQDFNPVWIDIIKRYFLVQGGEIVVFGDASQNIYHRPLDNKGQIKIEVARNGWNNSLTRSHRFLSKALSDLVIKFHNTFIYSTMSHFEGSQASLFEEFRSLCYYSLSHEATPEQISGIINKIIIERELASSDIAIVSNQLIILRDVEQCLRTVYGKETKTTFATNEEIREVRLDARFPDTDIENIERSKKIHFTVENQCIKVSSIHSFKGWETPNLILIIEQTEGNSELIYTALTRARERVFVINCGNTKYHDFFSNYQG